MARPAFSPDWPGVALVAAGGGAGSLARYGLTRLWPEHAGAVPTTTLFINVLGSFLLGVLVVAVTQVWTAHRLVRPALGTGLIGGFTTFSSFMVQTRTLAADSHPGVAALYLGLSIVLGLLATVVGMQATRELGPHLSATPTGLTRQDEPMDPDV